MNTLTTAVSLGLSSTQAVAPQANSLGRGVNGTVEVIDSLGTTRAKGRA